MSLSDRCDSAPADCRPGGSTGAARRLPCDCVATRSWSVEDPVQLTGYPASHLSSDASESCVRLQCGTGLSRGPSTDRIKSYLRAIRKTGSLPNPCCDCAASSSDQARCPTVVREGLYGPAGVGAAGGRRRGLNERYCYGGRNEEAVLMDRCTLCIASITPSMVRT